MFLKKYEIERSFDQSVKMREDQDLSLTHYNWSNMFCIKFFKRDNQISIKNKFYYSVKLCHVDEFDPFIRSLVFRIYIHPMEAKPDLEKDYVYKYVFKQEAKYAELDIYFERTESLLLPLPYWTECKTYLGNSTRSECIDECLIRRLKLKPSDHINLVATEYNAVKKNYTVRNECVIKCGMPCRSSFYLLNHVAKKKENETRYIAHPKQTKSSSR